MQIRIHNWHTRTSHTNTHKLAITSNNCLVSAMLPIRTDVYITCSPCQHAELNTAPHKYKHHHYAPGAYISSDTCDPNKYSSNHRNNRILTIIRAASRYAIVHHIKDKRDIPNHINDDLRQASTHHKRPPTDFRSEDAKEYMSEQMQTVYSSHRVQQHLETPLQHQGNSVAERLNCTIKESA